MSVGYQTSANIGVRIVDVSNPANPLLVGRIPLKSSGFAENHTHGDAVVTRISSGAFQGDVAIVQNGVPDGIAQNDPAPFGHITTNNFRCSWIPKSAYMLCYRRFKARFYKGLIIRIVLFDH